MMQLFLDQSGARELRIYGIYSLPCPADGQLEIVAVTAHFYKLRAWVTDAVCRDGKIKLQWELDFPDRQVGGSDVFVCLGPCPLLRLPASVKRPFGYVLSEQLGKPSLFWCHCIPTYVMPVPKTRAAAKGVAKKRGVEPNSSSPAPLALPVPSPSPRRPVPATPSKRKAMVHHVLQKKQKTAQKVDKVERFSSEEDEEEDK
ncbi:hypothetical protein CDD81_5336 [Ophiocordyceps australis]|uniref:Uncharacterized protein n=1 Tax=Ophiocordyceps australis TaxID=1399860 RepID=A0A2C5XIJ2_9HYPO|nr:hypothetical protein CDD81_5336 [Ophiocordyceps australis]